MKVNKYMKYEKEILDPKLFNEKGDFFEKYRPLLEYFTWHLRYILDHVTLNETAEDELESFYSIIEDYYPKKRKKLIKKYKGDEIK